MKFGKILVAVVSGLVALAFTASAQLGFDVFKGASTYQLGTPQNIVAGGALTTNGPIDLLGLIGVAKIDVLLTTNSAATAVTATLFSSTNQSAMVQISNVWYATPTTIGMTNNYYAYAVTTNGTLPGTTISYFTNQLTASNSRLLAGSISTPSAASSGFSTPYVQWNANTNNGTCTLTGNSTTEFGFNVKDVQGRYLYIVYGASGTVTNASVGAIVTAATMQPNY